MIKYEKGSSPTGESPTNHTNGTTVRLDALTSGKTAAKGKGPGMRVRRKVPGCLLCLTNAMTSDLELDVRSFFIFVSAFMYTHLRLLLSHIDIQ